jgi:hypothetical protein
MKLSIFGAAFLSVCLASSAVHAAPGDPFGGSETGCIPADEPGLACGKALTGAFGKLVAGVIKCHLSQVKGAFQAVGSSPALDAAEEACTAKAKDKFDASLTKASASCDPAVVAAAEARRDAFLADVSNMTSLDSLNGAFFCDASSGLSIADAGGGDQDEAGSIPASADNYKCAVGFAKSVSKLLASIYKCHGKVAASGFVSKPFVPGACDDMPKGARAKHNTAMQKLIDKGICPPCLADGGSGALPFALGAGTLSFLDSTNAEIYPCAP